MGSLQYRGHGFDPWSGPHMPQGNSVCTGQLGTCTLWCPNASAGESMCRKENSRMRSACHSEDPACPN